MNSRGMCRSKAAGYSLVEMVMTLAIGLILAAITLPTLIGAIQGYRLSSAAQQAAGLIDLTRYTAIRRNAVISLQRTVQNGGTVLYVDLNGNGQLDANEPLMLIPSDMQIATGGSAPDATSTGLNNVQNFSGTITFDYRGALSFPLAAGTGPYFLPLGYVNQAQFGYRAVTVLPMGPTRLWKTNAGVWVPM